MNTGEHTGKLGDCPRQSRFGYLFISSAGAALVATGLAKAFSALGQTRSLGYRSVNSC